MKMVLVAYNEAIDVEVMSALKASAIKGFTKWTKVLGSGTASEPHMLTNIWPKANNVVAVAVEDAQAAQLLDHVRRLRQTLGHEGIKAFVLPLESMT